MKNRTTPISEHGAKIAATRIGVTVEEYRRREAAGERWCPRCETWVAPREQSTLPYCSPCWNAYRREWEASQRTGITYVRGASS